MKRNQIAHLRVSLAVQNREYPATMTEIPEKAWPFETGDPRLTNPPKRAWRSSRFIACLYAEPEKTALRLSICRATLNDNGQFDDQLTWDELQQIKSERGFGAYDAVEIYPADADVVNVSNMRHLWLLDYLSPYAWR